MSIKHAGHILAFTKAFTDSVLQFRQGVNHNTSYERFIEEAPGHLFIGRRHELESNQSFRQLLPYTLIVRCEPDFTNQEVFAYQRTKAVGESRLAGNVSVGVGGHVDLADLIVQDESTVDLRATIIHSMQRETYEEVEFTDKTGHVITLASAPERFVLDHYGFIRDDSDEVGQLHLAVVNVVFVPAGTEVKIKEEELVGLGFFKVGDLLKSDYPLEGWTKLVLEDLAAQDTQQAEAA